MCLAFNEKLEKNGNTSLSFRCNVQAPAPFALYGKDRCVRARVRDSVAVLLRNRKLSGNWPNCTE